MRRKELAIIAITALMSLTVVPILAEEILQIEDFKVVKAFPSEMIAGSTYEAIYQSPNAPFFLEKGRLKVVEGT